MNLPETITYETDGHVATIALNRPDAHNAMPAEMMAGLGEVFEAFNADGDLWVAILTDTGDKAFCAGADLGQLIPLMVDSGLESFLGNPSKRSVSDIYKPIVCAVNGLRIAGGLEIMQGTDLRIAVEHATFGLGEVRWGIIPAGGSHVRLSRQIPWAVAMEILLTGRPITAERAGQQGGTGLGADHRGASTGRGHLPEQADRGTRGEGDRGSVAESGDAVRVGEPAGAAGLRHRGCPRGA